MAIKVNGATVITDSRRGVFRTVNPGTYTTADRPAGASEGDIIYDTDEKTILVWSGTEWVSAGSSKGNTFYLYLNGETSSTALSYTLDLRPYQKIINVSTLICTQGDSGSRGGDWHWCNGADWYGSTGGRGGNGGAIYADIRNYDGVGYPSTITYSTNNTTVEGYSTATRISGPRAQGGNGGESCVNNRYGAQYGQSTSDIDIADLAPWSFYIKELKGNGGGSADTVPRDGQGRGGGGGAGYTLEWQPYTELFPYTGTQNGPGNGGGQAGGIGDSGSANQGNGNNGPSTPGHNGFIFMAINAEIADD